MVATLLAILIIILIHVLTAFLGKEHRLGEEVLNDVRLIMIIVALTAGIAGTILH